jgi:hypothetical protein
VISRRRFPLVFRQDGECLAVEGDRLVLGPPASGLVARHGQLVGRAHGLAGFSPVMRERRGGGCKLGRARLEERATVAWRSRRAGRGKVA